MSKEIKSIIKNLWTTKKAKDQIVSLVNSSKHLQKNLSYSFPNFQKFEEVGGDASKLILQG